MKTRLLVIAALALAVTAQPTLAAGKDKEKDKDSETLRERVQVLEKQLQELKAAVADAERKAEAVAAQQEKTAAAPSATSLFGYGEIAFLQPRLDSSAATGDVARAVFGIGHRFSDSTRFTSEFEVEHTVASASDPGEVEVEQFYVDQVVSDSVSFKTGLFLMPIGLLNEHHESPAYSGVERNQVETAIIPTTWREGGIGIYGHPGFGLAWDLGVTTGFDLSKWDASSSEGREAPLASIHQELALAKARDASVYLALNYQALPSLGFGASVFTGGASQGQAGFAAPDARVTLWEAHSRYRNGPFTLSALYAQGRISNTDALNLSFAGQPTPVPREFFGGYLEPSFQVWQRGTLALTPFARIEQFNTASRYDSTTTGLGYAALPTEQVLSYGFSFFLDPQVAIKVDYADYREDQARDRYGVGLGLSF